MKRRRPITRRSQARQEQRRPALEPRFYAEQTSAKFVPPTPVEAERNALVAEITEQARRQLAADTAEQRRLTDAGEAIAVLRELKGGGGELGGVHADDQDAARAEVTSAADASPAFPEAPRGALEQIVRNVAAKYIVQREVATALASIMASMSNLLKRAGITDRQAHCWIVNEILDAGEAAARPHALAGGRLLGVAPNNFSERVTQAHAKLRATPDGLAEAQRLVAADATARASIVRLTDQQYDQMIGPENRKGGRSVRPDQQDAPVSRGYNPGGRGTGSGEAGEKRR